METNVPLLTISILAALVFGYAWGNRSKEQAPNFPDIAPGRLMHISLLPPGRYMRCSDPRIAVVTTLRGKNETAVWSEETIDEKFVVKKSGRIRTIEKRAAPLEDE